MLVDLPTERTEVTKNPTESRIAWVDQTKGLGILLVVAAHVGVNSVAFGWIGLAGVAYVFHMPLFFILSGFVYRKPLQQSDLIIKRITTLIVPYCAFLLILGSIFLLVTGVHHLSILKYLGRLVLGGNFLIGWFGTFWFITCLITTQIVYNAFALRAAGHAFAAPLVFAVLAGGLCMSMLSMAHLKVALPFALEVVPMALVFFWFGQVYRSERVARPALIKAAAVISAVCGLAALRGYGSWFSFDMKNSEYGIPVVGAALAISLSVLFIEALRLIPLRSVPARLLRKLGEASLVIMFLHQSCIYAFKSAGVTSDFVIFFLSFALPYAVYEVAGSSVFLRRVLLGKVQTPSLVVAQSLRAAHGSYIRR